MSLVSPSPLFELVYILSPPLEGKENATIWNCRPWHEGRWSPSIWLRQCGAGHRRKPVHSDATQWTLWILMFFAFLSLSVFFAAKVIADWCAAFGVPNRVMSDGPTHFRNEIDNAICKGTKVPLYFTLPYSPQSNEGIERLGRELVRIFPSVHFELQLTSVFWEGDADVQLS